MLESEIVRSKTANDTAANGETASRTYKATVFAMVFREKTALLSLYNAVNGTDYQDPEQLEINTLENARYRKSSS